MIKYWSAIGDEFQPSEATTPKYPFRIMQVGQSFFIPNEDMQNKDTLRKAILYYQHKLQMKFTMRTYENGVRVWRIA